MGCKRMKQIPTFIDLDTTAAILGISRSTVKRFAQEGKLPAAKIGDRIWRINQDELVERLRSGKL